jgi:hypothetical protein
MDSAKAFFRIGTLCKLSAVFLVTLYYSCVIQQPVLAQRENVNFQVFYDQLSPYGQWVDYPEYGYVWIPDADPDFEPYSTAGHWVMTEYGWTWVSDYPWGWAPFHYGRWDFNDDLGWFWIPDNEWGPAWVTWRRANGYYGWAPLRPGISISLSFNSGYRDVDRWCFVRDRDFGRPDINRYYLSRRDYDPIIRSSTVINNTYIDNSRHTTYVAGPPREDVQRVTGRRISSLTIRDENRPGQTVNNNQLRIYRPQVERNTGTNQRPAPSRITNFKDVRPTRERSASPQRNVITPSENNRREQNQAQPQQQRQVQQPRQEQPQQQIDRGKQEQQPRQFQPQQQQIDRGKLEQQPRQIQPQQQMGVRNQAQPQQTEKPRQQLGQQKREQRKAERVQRRNEQQQRIAPANPSNDAKGQEKK